jgi:SAM-dependent methyltransferase
LSTPHRIDLADRPLVPEVEVACDLCGSTATDTVATGVDFDYQTCRNTWSFVRCRVCGLEYLNPRPDVTALEVIYPATYEPFLFHETRNPFMRYGRAYVQRRKAVALRRLAGDEATIIDVGCGSGQLLDLLRRHGPKGWRLIGNDFSDLAAENVQRLGLEYLGGRFEELDTELRFDVVVLNQTLEHLERPAAVVEKAALLLRPGGILFIETPSTDSLDARAFRRRRWGGYHFPRHWTLFTEQTLGRLVGEHGFEVIEVRYLASPAFWCQSFNHLALETAFPAPRFWSLHNPLTLMAFTALDVARSRVARTSNLRLVARRR